MHAPTRVNTAMGEPVEMPSLSRLQTARGMRSWTISSALAAVYTSVTTGAYSTGYALYLGASNAQIGLLSAAPSWGQLLQILSPLLIERLRRRKPLCLSAYALSYTLWAPIALLPWLLPPPARVMGMIVLVAFAGVAVALAAPASTSWLTDLVPTQARARFVSRQQSAMSLVGLGASVAAGRYLDVLGRGRQGSAFATLFAVAVVFGLAAVVAWALAGEPPKAAARRPPGLAALALPLRNANFRNFTAFVAGRTTAVMIAAPFFTVYMLRYLNIPYSQIAIFSALSTIATIAGNPAWAYLADKFGYRPVIQLSGFALALVPLIWFFTTRDNYVIVTPLAMLWAGFMAAGIILGQFNLLLKVAPDENRSVYLGWHSALVSLAVAVGSATGGALADSFERLGTRTVAGFTLSHLHLVFLISFVARATTQLLLYRVVEADSVPARVLIGRVGSGHSLATVWHLVRMFRSRDPGGRASSARALGGSRGTLAVEELTGLLDDTDRDVRREAARALGQIADPRAVPALIDKALDDVAGIELDALEALGRIPAPESTEFLARMLEDPRPAVRISAALGLGNSEAPEAAAPLERLLRREHSVPVFVTAAEALGRVAGVRALHQLRLLLARATRDVVRRELANAIANLLGPPDEFYRTLHADPIQREELVVRSVQHTRQVLAARARADAGEYVTNHAHRALTAFAGGDYSSMAQSLYRSATRALVAASRSRDYARLIAQRRHEVPVTARDRRLRVLLRAHEKLRANYGFLGGLRDDAAHRSLSLEEGLLAAFAFERIATRLERLRRGNADRDGRDL